ncbi:MAG TPA: hypothetical protein VGP58_09770 [Pyrinomonadaceae bacterium]|nr:hypothetical protein [Pyrinomonadaceae bacterium]
MTAPLEPQIAAKFLQKIKRECRASHAKTDNRQRRKREKCEFPNIGAEPNISWTASSAMCGAKLLFESIGKSFI